MWWNNIPRENKKCNFCNLEEIGDEFHYIIDCSYFKQYKYLYQEKMTQKDQILLISWGLWRQQID